MKQKQTNELKDAKKKQAGEESQEKKDREEARKSRLGDKTNESMTEQVREWMSKGKMGRQREKVLRVLSLHIRHRRKKRRRKTMKKRKTIMVRGRRRMKRIGMTTRKMRESSMRK